MWKLAGKGWNLRIILRIKLVVETAALGFYNGFLLTLQKLPTFFLLPLFDTLNKLLLVRGLYCLFCQRVFLLKGLLSY